MVKVRYNSVTENTYHNLTAKYQSTESVDGEQDLL